MPINVLLLPMLLCRFANPASLNGATSWVFINSPDNVQHVCAANVKNYNMRYLPVSTSCSKCPCLLTEEKKRRAQAPGFDVDEQI
jgi:hypothetical protein